MKTSCLTDRPKKFFGDYADKKCMEHKSYLALLQENVAELISEGYTRFISGARLNRTFFSEQPFPSPYSQICLQSVTSLKIGSSKKSFKEIPKADVN